jgi:hypothetical protein
MLVITLKSFNWASFSSKRKEIAQLCIFFHSNENKCHNCANFFIQMKRNSTIVHLFFIQMKRNRTQCNSGFGFEARFFSKLRSWSFFSKIWLAEVLLLWLHVKIFLLLEFYWQLRLTPLPWPCLHSEMMIIIIFVDCGTSKMSKSLNLKNV